MRAHEFLRESTGEDAIRDELTTLLTTLHASQVPSVSLQQLKKSLQDAGYYVTRKWIQDNAQKLGIVKSVDEETAMLDIETDEPEPTAPETKSDEERVSQMAKKALSRRK